MNYEDMAHLAWAQKYMEPGATVTKRHVAPRWNRSPILSFSELTPEQQKTARAEAYNEEDRYVYINRPGGHEVLPLSMFMRTERSNVWHGVYGTSAFSAYFIRINRTGEEALVAEKFS